jgi:hypothetical protein
MPRGETQEKKSEMNRLTAREHVFDVCVIGGGMAGMCAAIASARHGAKTAIVQDRPVFGGNASSEIRMWICGAHGENNKETGLLEEIQLENLHRNHSLNYSIWDSVLYGKIRYQPNLTPFLNCTCTDAEMDGMQIASVSAWQMSTQTWHTIRAHQFIDCSGDSILAGITPAEFRMGREARGEFDEDIEPAKPDRKTMGSSLLLQMRRTDQPQPFVSPRWAYKFTAPEDFAHRMEGVNGTNFWWLEIGGLCDTITDSEEIRDELMKIGYGVWDYIKNYAPERAKSECWALEWMGSLPGKRESRRYVGAHVLTQNDVRAGGQFGDVVAYGGWSMDDHHPGGLLYPGEPTIYHPAPSPYGIPFRCLYSRNVSNLLFAGRNVSVTHAALSSTRVMATCALLGQAAGTAAALCVKNGFGRPDALSSGNALNELQQALMDDDCWLPGRTRTVSDLLQTALLRSPVGNADIIRDGNERDLPGGRHAWSGAAGDWIELSWPHQVEIGSVRIVLDSNLNNDKRMPCSYPQHSSTSRTPKSLIKSFRIEQRGTAGSWATIHREANNFQRLLTISLPTSTSSLRLVPEETWGAEQARVFTFESMRQCEARIPSVPDGPLFREARAKTNPIDLLPPENGREQA